MMIMARYSILAEHDLVRVPRVRRLPLALCGFPPFKADDKFGDHSGRNTYSGVMIRVQDAVDTFPIRLELDPNPNEAHDLLSRGFCDRLTATKSSSSILGRPRQRHKVAGTSWISWLSYRNASPRKCQCRASEKRKAQRTDCAFPQTTTAFSIARLST